MKKCNFDEDFYCSNGFNKKEIYFINFSTEYDSLKNDWFILKCKIMLKLCDIVWGMILFS